MSDRDREPTDAEGPFLRAAYRRADQVDGAQTPAQRRRAWAGLLRAGAVALAEGFLRETMIWGAVLFSILAAIFGVTSGNLGWGVAMVASGIAGVMLVFWSQARRWAFGRQWAVLVGVLVVQCGLIVAVWQTTN